MNEYRLNSMWRERRIFGETLTDAVTREKVLRESDDYAHGVITKKGELRTIAQVLDERECDQSINDKTFGRHQCRIVAEFDDGKICEVWAEWQERNSFTPPAQETIDPRD